MFFVGICLVILSSCWSLAVCWPLCQLLGVSAGFCLPAGLFASLPAFLPVSACLLAFLSACRRFCRFLPACWPLCQPAGVSAGLCLPAGLFASLPAFLPVSACLLASLSACRRFCRSLCCAPCALVYWAIAGCLSLCLPVPGVFPSGGYIASVPLICAASTFHAFMFLVAQFLISVVHVDILLINACACVYFISFIYLYSVICRFMTNSMLFMTNSMLCFFGCG